MPIIDDNVEEIRPIMVRLRGDLLTEFDKMCEQELRSAQDMIRYLIAKELERRAAKQMALFPADGQS